MQKTAGYKSISTVVKKTVLSNHFSALKKKSHLSKFFSYPQNDIPHRYSEWATPSDLLGWFQPFFLLLLFHSLLLFVTNTDVKILNSHVQEGYYLLLITYLTTCLRSSYTISFPAGCCLRTFFLSWFIRSFHATTFVADLIHIQLA